MLYNKNKKYIFIFIATASLGLCANPICAEDIYRFWNKEKASDLNVINDLKQGRGREWYVDAKTGNDETGDGRSLKAQFKTIAKAVEKLGPGDTIIISAGLYRERLYIKKSGAEDNRIIIGPRGNGEVIIDASEKIGEWIKAGKNIFKTAYPSNPAAVVMDEQPLFPEFSLASLSGGKWYFDKTNKFLYLYIADDRGPAGHDIGIISNDSYQEAINIHGANNVTIYGITVRFAGGCGVSILGSNNRIEMCDIKYNGNIGVRIFSYGDIHSTNNIIANNHAYHNFIRNWPRGRYKSGGWGAGVVANTSSNNELIGNVVHKNGGEGLLAYGSSAGTLIKNNISYDNWSVNIYIDGQSDCVVEKNLIFCNEPNPGDLYNNEDETPQDGKNLRRLRAEGIMTADENSPANFKNAKITNNIIISCRRGITHYAPAKDSGLKNVLIADNTIILPDSRGAGEDYIGIRIPYNNGNNHDVILRNNIISGSHPKAYLLSVEGIAGTANSSFNGLTFEGNAWHHSGNPKPFQIRNSWIIAESIDFNKFQDKCKAQDRCLEEKFSLESVNINLKDEEAIRNLISKDE